jgi:hypothetical protein
MAALPTHEQTGQCHPAARSEPAARRRDLKAVAEEPQVATKHDGQECIQKITPRKPNQFNPLPGTQNQSLIVFTNTLQFSWD